MRFVRTCYSVLENKYTRGWKQYQDWWKYMCLMLRFLVEGLIQTDYWLPNWRKGNNSICSHVFWTCTNSTRNVCLIISVMTMKSNGQFVRQVYPKRKASRFGFETASSTVKRSGVEAVSIPKTSLREPQSTPIMTWRNPCWLTGYSFQDR